MSTTVTFAVGQIWRGTAHTALGAARREIIAITTSRILWRDAECHRYECWETREAFAAWARELETAKEICA